jgi:hypothetical protein
VLCRAAEGVRLRLLLYGCRCRQRPTGIHTNSQAPRQQQST